MMATLGVFLYIPCRYTKELTLSNTSDIPMRFSWRVPEDEKAEPREMLVSDLAVCVRARNRSLPLLSFSVCRYGLLFVDTSSTLVPKTPLSH